MVTKNLTIVMYHFVRDLLWSKYPDIKGLSLDKFVNQIKYITSYYTPVKMEDVIDVFYYSKRSLPSNPILLTFDDGYIDHFLNVYPILDGFGIQGSFFPPAKAIIENQVLDVNKIHFVLACNPDKHQIIETMFSMLDKLRPDYALKDRDYYQANVSVDSRFDVKEVVFIKKMLQMELPEPVRNRIVDELFKTYVTENEASFSRELYMNIDQIRCMKRNGMFIGSHGYDHYWLATLDRVSQEREIDLSLTFLNELGCDAINWVMCYPYGSYNDRLLSLLRSRGCKLGLTTRVAIADLDGDDPLTLPRLDTNDLPTDPDAEAHPWTLKGLQ